jgi:hypothetical protein
MASSVANDAGNMKTHMSYEAHARAGKGARAARVCVCHPRLNGNRRKRPRGRKTTDGATRMASVLCRACIAHSTRFHSHGAATGLTSEPNKKATRQA